MVKLKTGNWMWFWIIGGSVAISLGMIFLQIPATALPVTAVNQYQAAMRVARDFQAHQYAPDELQMAESEWQKAMELWKLENQKWFWQRDYSSVIQTLSTAATHAEIAGKSSIHRKQSIIETVNKQLSRISLKTRFFEKQYGNLPLRKKIKKNLGQSGLLFNEATSAIDRGENTVAQSRLVKSEAFIDQSITALEKQLTGYFAGLAQWQVWVKDAINQSKRNRENVIIIDKMALTCNIYNAGKLVFTAPIEMGPNWMGDKNQRGDRKTPEGIYSISDKKSGSQTRYYKALLINYPNELDRRRFNAAKSTGDLSQKAQIGGLIEVHGDGGKGFHWTDGCIALTNTDMDQVIQKARVGTRIVIVGSLKPMSAYFSKINLSVN